MLSMALVHELALNTRTLILDLDFFNRGLTGLLKTGKLIASVAPPQFISGDCAEAQNDWCLIQVAPNVVTLKFPDIDRAQRQCMEMLSTDALSVQLCDYVQRLMQASDTQAVVLDCHGGPDILSFAAISVAARTILVSEPDRITFFGTLHFVRRMAEDCPHPCPDVRLVFNKVMPAFSEHYLRRFYRDHVKDLFGERDLLAVVPFEAYLSKEFERSPFVTAVFPYSQLAYRARLMVQGLGMSGPAHPSVFVRFCRWCLRLTGDGARLVPRFLDLDIVTTVAAVVLMVWVLLAVLTDTSAHALIGPISPVLLWLRPALLTLGVEVAALVGIWLFQALLLNWIGSLDRSLTRLIRVKSRLKAAALFVVLVGIGVLLLFPPIVWMYTIMRGLPPNPLPRVFYVMATASAPASHIAAFGFYFLWLVTAWAAANLIARTIVCLLHEKRWVEGTLRLIGCAGVATIWILMMKDSWNDF